MESLTYFNGLVIVYFTCLAFGIKDGGFKKIALVSNSRTANKKRLYLAIAYYLMFCLPYFFIPSDNIYFYFSYVVIILLVGHILVYISSSSNFFVSKN